MTEEKQFYFWLDPKVAKKQDFLESIGILTTKHKPQDAYILHMANIDGKLHRYTHRTEHPTPPLDSFGKKIEGVEVVAKGRKGTLAYSRTIDRNQRLTPDWTLYPSKPVPQPPQDSGKRKLSEKKKRSI